MRAKSLILIVCAVVLILCGCAAHKTENASVPEPDASQPQPSTAATEESTEPATEPEVILPTQPAEPVLHSGLREDGSFDSGTLFIGDSQTFLFIEHQLRTSGTLGDARYAAQCGSQLTAFWDSSIRPTQDRSFSCTFSEEFEGFTFAEAAAYMGSEATAIYLMWGSNYTPDATAQSYIDILDALLEICPNATIHLQTIPYGYVPYKIVNERIHGAYQHFQEIGESRVMLVDTFTAIGRLLHNDKIHVSPAGRQAWYDAIVAHAAEHNLQQ